MSDGSKDLIQVHSDMINKRLDRFDDLFDKIYSKMDENNTILSKLTVIVDEHQRRSTALEKIVDVMKESFAYIQQDLLKLAREIKDVSEDVEPLKLEMVKVTKTYHFFSGVPIVVKGLLLICTLTTSLFGLWQIVKIYLLK